MACLPNMFAAPYSVSVPSGDPTEAVLLALEAAEKVFGVDINSRGYKVPKGCGVIQGDGISIEVLDQILQAVMAQGYSAQVRWLDNIPAAHEEQSLCTATAVQRLWNWVTPTKLHSVCQLNDIINRPCHITLQAGCCD